MSAAARFACAVAALFVLGPPAAGYGDAGSARSSSASEASNFDECVADGGRVAMKDPPICYLGNRAFERGAAAEPADETAASEEAPKEETPAEDGPPPDSVVSITPGEIPEPRKRPVPPAERYELDPDPGHCEAAIAMYYYDRDEKKCKEFFWGGCGGTVPFETLEECESGLFRIER